MRRLLGILLLASAVAAQPIPVIFDTDIGSDIDDAFALAFLLQSPEFHVLAVTTARFDAPTRAALARKILRAYGRLDIPVASGGSEGLLNVQNRVPKPQFDLLSPEDTLPEEHREQAVQLMHDILRRSPDKVTLIPVGPLTNIALLLKTAPSIKAKIARIVLMGGAFDINRAETNIHNDYAAAAIVFQSGVPITAVSQDVSRLCELKGQDLEKIRSAGNPAPQLLIRLMERWRTWRVGRNPVLFDAVPIAILIQPDICEYESGRVDVEYAGMVTRGFTRFTPAGRLPAGEQATTKITRNIDLRRFMDLFTERVAAAPRRSP
jgi:inosine-uridine nucleoside N-ribohydrolase